ncbi:MAG: hypothetical protein D6732_18755 [Methanobacteriota archaeon]|nr:MAG: hypothetical protein D6732_18755 [Euryarchaeota archaeon]
MLSTKHVTSLFFIGILVMSGVAPVLEDTFEVSNTAVSPLVVQFGDSVEELAAIAELKSNFPRARVVDFSAYDMIVSFKGPVIYVGHSSDEGVQYNGKTISWDVLVDIIRISKSNSHYMLGCESSKVIKLTEASGKQVFAFQTVVDAIMGATLVSYLVFIRTPSFQSINVQQWMKKIEERAEHIFSNPRIFMPLDNFGSNEKLWHSIYAVFMSLALLDPILHTIGRSVRLGIKTWMGYGFLTTVAAIAHVLHLLILNYEWIEVSWKFTELAVYFLENNGPSIAVSVMPTIQAAIFLSSVAAMAALSYSSAQTTTYLTLIADTVSFALWAEGYIHDLHDDDDTFYLFEDLSLGGGDGNGVTCDPFNFFHLIFC